MSETDTTTRHTITGRQLTRRNFEAAIAKATMPVMVTDCDMEGVDLSRLDLTGFTFESCAMIDVDLSYVTAPRTLWKGCRSRKVVMRGADLSDARVEGGDWNNSDWQAAKLAGTKIRRAKLTGASFKEARTMGISFEDCLMQSAELVGISFRRMKLGRCDMGRADVRECDMRQASFAEGSSLAGAMISGAKFQDADLREVDLSGHGLDSVKHLFGARISMHQAAAMVAAAGLRVG